MKWIGKWSDRSFYRFCIAGLTLVLSVVNCFWVAVYFLFQEKDYTSVMWISLFVTILDFIVLYAMIQTRKDQEIRQMLAAKSNKR